MTLITKTEETPTQAELANKKAMITDILLQCKANNTPATDKVGLALAFRSESELVKICQELNIKPTTDKREATLEFYIESEDDGLQMR